MGKDTINILSHQWQGYVIKKRANGAIFIYQMHDKPDSVHAPPQSFPTTTG